MTTDEGWRDIVPSGESAARADPAGRAYIAVIGIDRYLEWDRLYSAVNDSSAILKLFIGLGFEPVNAPLHNEAATGDALRRLVTDDLSSLQPEDSLVLFFAGHGHTMTRAYGGTTVKDGYIIPVDGRPPGSHVGSWIRLESWLTEITRIPAQHILVILDACHSGLALGPIIQWRSRGLETPRKEPLDQLRARRSRRIITSALDDQLAMDSGPVPGHSLFTGCLIEALTGGLFASTGYPVVTGSEIGHYVQRRVSEYPRSRQTPDFGALELDDRGELLVRIAMDGTRMDAAQAPAGTTLDGASSTVAASAGQRSRGPWVAGGTVAVVSGIVAALLAIRDDPPSEAMTSPAGSPRDAGVAVGPTDGTPRADTPNAAPLGSSKASMKPVTMDSPPSMPPSSQRKADGQGRQHLHRGVHDASSTGSDALRIDDHRTPTGSDAPSIDDRSD